MVQQGLEVPGGDGYRMITIPGWRWTRLVAAAVAIAASSIAFQMRLLWQTPSSARGPTVVDEESGWGWYEQRSATRSTVVVDVHGGHLPDIEGAWVWLVIESGRLYGVEQQGLSCGIRGAAARRLKEVTPDTFVVVSTVGWPFRFVSQVHTVDSVTRATVTQGWPVVHCTPILLNLLVLGALALAPVLIAERGLATAKRSYRHQPGDRCLVCAYSLLGLHAGARCPECGNHSPQGRVNLR